jgi:gp16 family phage-associated protein
MKARKALTPDQVKQQFRARGLTLTQWAADRGYNREAVYRVLNGKDKAHFGRAHEIAVALGLKVPDEEPSTTTQGRNTQARAAA